MDDMREYFSGKKLYGDDFTASEIEQWYLDESEGYANLGAGNKKKYVYGYHELNKYHAFRKLDRKLFRNALGMGSAYGDEFKPIAGKISKLTIIDSSEVFSSDSFSSGVGITSRVRPHPSGKIQFPDEEFDLICCLGVMHHVPNVSYVLKECARCLAHDGIMILREPIVSMGDWRSPRRGLTSRERGIPINLFQEIFQNAGLIVLSKSLCNFSLIPVISNWIGVSAYNSRFFTVLDDVFSRVFSSNTTYHRDTFLKKIGPASVYYTLMKAPGNR